MNVIGLMTRGYLGPVGLLAVGPTPVIISVASQHPEIDAALERLGPSPSIVGVAQTKPSITKTRSQIQVQPASPSIIGGRKDKPTIRGK
jgi:hypothetical protein